MTRQDRSGGPGARTDCVEPVPPAARAQACRVLLPPDRMRSLVISPFSAERVALAELLRSEGYEVTAAADRAEGLALAGAERPDAVIADAQVPGLDGLALVRDLSARGPMPRLILLCPRAGRAVESDDVTCLTKPIDLGALHQLLARLAAGSRSA